MEYLNINLDKQIEKRVKNRIRNNKRKVIKKVKKKKRDKIPLKYTEYIASKFWKKRKEDYFNKFGKICFICKTKYAINLHHLKYGNNGKEKDEHLIALCNAHHAQFHEDIPLKADMTKEGYEWIEDQLQLIEKWGCT